MSDTVAGKVLRKFESKNTLSYHWQLKDDIKKIGMSESTLKEVLNFIKKNPILNKYMSKNRLTFDNVKIGSTSTSNTFSLGNSISFEFPINASAKYLIGVLQEQVDSLKNYY